LDKEVDTDFEHFYKQTLDQTMWKFYAEARQKTEACTKNLHYIP